MRRVVLIEDSLDARYYVRDHAPADWEILEAVVGRHKEQAVALAKWSAQGVRACRYGSSDISLARLSVSA